MMMHRIFVLFWVLILATNSVIAVPLHIQHKRQSDQRIAELETLLALHKYGVGPRRVGGRNSAGYGLIDFNYIGRRKKSSGGDDSGISLVTLMDEQLHSPPSPTRLKHFGTSQATSDAHQSDQSSPLVVIKLPPPPAGYMQNRLLSPPMHKVYME